MLVTQRLSFVCNNPLDLFDSPKSLCDSSESSCDLKALETIHNESPWSARNPELSAFPHQLELMWFTQISQVGKHLFPSCCPGDRNPAPLYIKFIFKRSWPTLFMGNYWLEKHPDSHPINATDSSVCFHLCFVILEILVLKCWFLSLQEG